MLLPRGHNLLRHSMPVEKNLLNTPSQQHVLRRMGNKEKATKLKEEGNVLMGQHRFRRAYEKYTQAIQEDSTSAVLFANRAACLQAMKRFIAIPR